VKILVIGNGGREHALAWKLAQSPKVTKIFCAPGNGGIASVAECVSIKVDDIAKLVKFAVENKMDWTVVGPEASLVAGVVDAFQGAGLKIFGPAKAAAAIEGSKALAKDIMVKYNIPTAKAATFTNSAEALKYIEAIGAPCVVKADGLAAGKGVVVAMDKETALEAVKMIMEEKVFGESGSKLVVEEYLEGEEVSILAFTDGQTVVPMVSAQDHKRIFDGDQGPNTGGMGAYSPAPIYTQELAHQVQLDILEPTIRALAQEGREYTGVIYAGLMITKDGPKVLEYNARFGDPETQPVLMRLETDLIDIMEAVAAKKLRELEIKWSSDATVCVVLASGGYPGSYKTGIPITGLEQANQADGSVYVFHGGTKLANGQVVTNGGRVLGVTAKGTTVREAVDQAYHATDKINFGGMHYRKDIAYRAL
jgi:phosphoribosylamine--glycine ligase